MTSVAGWFISISSAFIAFVIYTLFFGDSSFHEKGIVGKFSRLLGNFFDALCGDKTRSILRRVLGNKICGCLERSEDYVCLSRNPLMPAVYVAFVLFGFAVFMQTAWPMIGQSELVPSYHKYGAILMVSFCFAVFAAALKADPGVITQENVGEYLQRFPFDNILYKPDSVCSTCNTQKPARSKHCRICNRCVSRFDHHCPWLNNCIGERNLRFFLLFLLSHIMLCMYGAFLIALMMLAFAIQTNLFEMQIFDEYGIPQPISTRMMIQFILYHHSTCVCLGIALFLIAMVLSGFLAYHLYLVAQGTTTNESYKWKDLHRKHHKQRKQIDAEKKKIFDESMENSENSGESVATRENKAKAAAAAKVVDDIPHVTNRYNQGFATNLFNVLFPPTEAPMSARDKAAKIAKLRAKKPHRRTDPKNLADTLSRFW